jgi:putative transcriptional regulator
MQGSLNLTGHILAMPPRGSNDSIFEKSVVLIAQHKNDGAWGLIVNKINTKITLDKIMESAGINDYLYTDTVYTGGPVEQQRVHILHTLDWRGMTTIPITSEIGVTGDISVLAAISRGEGPRLFRTYVGLSAWSSGQLEGEYKGLPPWNTKHSWLDAPATIDSVFNLKGDDQWEQAIDIIATAKVSDWL